MTDVSKILVDEIGEITNEIGARRIVYRSCTHFLSVMDAFFIGHGRIFYRSWTDFLSVTLIHWICSLNRCSRYISQSKNVYYRPFSIENNAERPVIHVLCLRNIARASISGTNPME